MEIFKLGMIGIVLTAMKYILCWLKIGLEGLF